MPELHGQVIGLNQTLNKNTLLKDCMSTMSIGRCFIRGGKVDCGIEQNK